MGEALNIIPLVVALLALVVSFIQLRRTRRQTNEDIIYANKIEGYRQVVEQTYRFVNESYLLLDALSDFEGDKNAWISERMPELYRQLNPLVEVMDSAFAKHVVLFPNAFVKLYNDFSFKSQRLLVEHYQFDAEHSHTVYMELTGLHNDMVNAVRHDLHIELLNEKLNYRLS
jgi:hypothetical protein